LAWSRRVKLLFDTHAFIWWDGEQSELSGVVLDACQSSTNSLHLSLASVWELQPVTLEDILALTLLPPFHRDPFTWQFFGKEMN
jgi:PIN domain nuclease of toxin-antitoxin system